MKRLALVFREVDKFALEFEDVTPGNSSSSSGWGRRMRDAR